MSANPDALISQYLENAITAEKSFEARLRGFACQEGGDDDVEAAFATHAERIRQQAQLLTSRLSELGVAPSENDNALVHAAEASADFGTSSIAEEQIARNLISAYTIGTTECALYEVLATVAQAAGDSATEALAREIQGERRTITEKIWHFLPSRSKIAFNMLTLDEVDPAVETRAADNRLVE